MKDTVLVLIKPDGVHKLVVGEVISHFLNHDLKMLSIKLVKVSKKLAIEHYGHLKDKSYFNETVRYLMGELHEGSPVIAMVLTGANAIQKARSIAGATNPEEAAPKSIRGKYGRITTKGIFENLVHVSSEESEARREIALWFKKSELLEQ